MALLKKEMKAIKLLQMTFNEYLETFIENNLEHFLENDKEEQIEGIINNENVQKTGMNQMTLEAIKNMVKAKKK